MEGYALMPRHAPCVPCLSSLLLIAAFAVLLRHLRLNLREVLTNAMLTILGYLMPRPDPSAENQLRSVFAEFDHDLAAILGDRSGHRYPPAGISPR
jgi:hypothetical protein